MAPNRIEIPMNGGNGRHPVSAEVIEKLRPVHLPKPAGTVQQPLRHLTAALVALALFLLTILSTLAVGAQFAQAYAENQPPFAADFSPYSGIFSNPSLLLTGLPFSFTLMGILLAHELGHFFACRYYGIPASYPYFIPFPSIIGTMGAFIRIRSPIRNRKALFDVGLAGPVVGFIFAVPALVLAVANSKIVPAAQASPLITFGDPLLMRLLMALFHPHVRPENILLHPVGRAAWVGLFATALNLLPAAQLDGGHIVYALAPEKHAAFSLAVAVALIPLGLLWWVWWLWAVLLLLMFFTFRHPALLDRWQPLDRKRRLWALAAILIFLLCFTPIPFAVHF